MHGIARLRLVGTPPTDGIEECSLDDAPRPLPFPTCIRNLPVGGHDSDAFDLLKAFDQVSLSFEKLRKELESNPGHDGPRAA